jgi:hypothetical protein
LGVRKIDLLFKKGPNIGCRLKKNQGNQQLGYMENSHHMTEENGIHNDDQDHCGGAQA